VRQLTSHREISHRSSINFGALRLRAARGGWPEREKWARTDDDDDPVEGELDDVSEAGREEEYWCRFVISRRIIAQLLALCGPALSRLHLDCLLQYRDRNTTSMREMPLHEKKLERR
jgi:hypothetical protein